MPIEVVVADRIAEVIFDHPPVNAFDSVTLGALTTVSVAAAGARLVAP